MIAWLNANSGAVTALATLGLVGLTAAYVILTRRIAAAARASADASKESVIATGRAAGNQAALAQAELFRNLITEYSQPGMSDALALLDQWSRNNAAQDDSLTEAARKWAGRVNYDRAAERDPVSAAEEIMDADLNRARRLTAHWHQKVVALVERGYFSHELVDEFRHWGSWRLVLRVVRALDIAHTEQVHNSAERAIRAYERMKRIFGTGVD